MDGEFPKRTDAHVQNPQGEAMTRPFELRQIVSGEGFVSADQNPVELNHWADITIRIDRDFIVELRLSHRRMKWRY
jgi:hypothetical protein